MKVKSKISYHVKERDGKDLKYTLDSNKIRKDTLGQKKLV
jgi:dTDP-D-glucose 4,6-dehydratase